MWQMINSFNDENKGICFKLNLAAKKNNQNLLQKLSVLVLILRWFKRIMRDGFYLGWAEIKKAFLNCNYLWSLDNV